MPESTVASLHLPSSSGRCALVPEGMYPATLTRMKPFRNQYGARIGFEFTLRGKHAGVTVMHSTAPNLTPASKLAELVRGLLGRELQDIEYTRGIDLEQLVGIDCHVLLRQARNRSGVTYNAIGAVVR